MYGYCQSHKFWRGTQKRAQSQKSGSQNEKNNTKTGIMPVFQEQTSLDQNSLPEVIPRWGDTKKVVLAWPLTSWSLGFAPILTQNAVKSNCIFHSKWRPDRALTFGYSNSQNFSFIRPFLRELLPKKPSNWAQLGLEPQNNSGFRRVKSRMINTQKLRVVDPETMSGWSYYILYEIFCQPFGQALKHTFQGMASFWNN